MNKTVGILAHVDAGKTTFSEQLLYHTKSIKHRGRVDHKDAFLDSHEIERQRGITVFADQALFSYGESDYFLIDTPGHVDFSPEMERTLQVMDYAIVIISAVEGIEGHTETIWELLKKYKVPTFFFINKTDRTGADVEEVFAEIREMLTPDVFSLDSMDQDGDMTDELIEFAAERNDVLFDYYIEHGFSKDLWKSTMSEMIKEQKLFACASGSALQDTGIKPFLEKMEQLTATSYSSEEPFAGHIYKIRHMENGTRVSFIKAVSGTLKVRDEIRYGKGENNKRAKITQIRIYNGSSYKTCEQAEAGQIFAVTGLAEAEIGDGVGGMAGMAPYEMVPALKSRVQLEPDINKKEVLKYFKILGAEDPSLNVIWDENLQEIHIHVMGVIQLEVLENLVLERFQLKTSFDEPTIVYKETIGCAVTGCGHFEPLGHYAEVHLRIEPGERNTGIQFENSCHSDDLSIGNQNLVRQHLIEKEHRGLLTGSSLTDIKVTLLTGRAHNKHTSGGDFREATLRALRQGLEKADNILLEPYYHFKIKVETEQMGRVMSDIQGAYGTFDPPTTDGSKTILTGTVPVATFKNYSMQLAAFTHGRGALSLIFAGYRRCHNENEVIKNIGYNKNADPHYTSSSIFCAKGQGYTVQWDKVEEQMHCL
ncbi:elongation factor G [Mesobacillus foraminis]|uniref:Small GTP-binding protein n=1 Tax=Mesobacillus foraminis TaxID=279826 RepID=A0A4R2BJH0_9BACI|nr:TetM/TetW/TetO/TetS family tetracycline resistance ribosomal protection protein [Mesobacillus foraminis]TCN27337.1 small GTP-binding protein [Mesobacillus foraminis]